MSTDLTASRALAPTGAKASPFIANTIAQFRGFAAQPAVAKSLPALGLVALIAIAALIWMAVSAAPQRDLMRGLADEEKGAVVEALKSGGIAYGLDKTSGTITVSEDEYHQAKMLLAAQGLPKSAPDGAQAIADLPLGSSRAVEGERLRSARELDLARTIEAIDTVETARVHLAVEAPSAFLRERSKPAASVMLTLTSGRSLSDQQVQAIVHLVASSVPGMSPDGVSVADQNGQLLSNRNDGGVSSETERQVAVQAKIEERYRQALETLLTPIVGAGNFTAQVHAEVDFSETQATREGFPKEASTVRSEEGATTVDAAEPTAGGIPGALSNQPPTAAEVTAAPNGAITPIAPGAPDPANAAGTKREENYNRSYAVGREVSVTRQQIGQVKRLSVAVALKNPDGAAPRSAQEVAALEKLVKGAVGFNGGRGDMVALTARAFAPSATDAPAWWEAGWVAMAARNVTALAVVLLFVFGIGKPLLKRSNAALARRAEAQAAGRNAVRGEIADAIAERAQRDPDTKVTLEMIEAARSYEARAALIRNFVRQDPARAALVVRDLIRADGKDGDHRHG
ncbi:flagellar basal-body MS-ring/collar protein FliF [Allosphingosinicella deserti]|uniref:Flagellar M-ring protein n=1 Tax=Allosphingosinicella deserti TaxID=2116704 RepID=A0A2P7QNX6_9SPHN|nr:flagellar basal-body MS-ring/collar protein FliF [Sphingomonas deserti]PSJ39673.1 flagellar M-ring protein FliF [Sphingomonas deserti]